MTRRGLMGRGRRAFRLVAVLAAAVACLTPTPTQADRGRSREETGRLIVYPCVKASVPNFSRNQFFSRPFPAGRNGGRAW